MDKSQYILSELHQYFKLVSAVSDKYPFDYVVCDDDKKPKFFIDVKYYASSVEEKDSIGWLKRDIDSVQMPNVPIIVLRIAKDTQIEFGIATYKEYGHFVYNKNINWRPLDADGVKWLNIQLEAKRMRIKLLPEPYWRVIKKIQLNSTMLVEAEIVYLRMMQKEREYIMKTKFPMDDQERFNRLIHGTPENEYPKDELDEAILKEVQRYYPSASVKSSLLLFETEMLDFRNYKDKQCKTGKIKIKYPDKRSEEIKIESYYYPNFRYIKNNPQIMLDGIESIFVSDTMIFNTYQPLSTLNV